MRTNSTCHALCLQEHALNCCQDWMHSKSTASSWHPVKDYNQLHPPTLTTVGHISQSYWCVRGSRRFAFSPAGQHSMPPHVVSAMATACNDGNLAIWATAKCRQRACLLHQRIKRYIGHGRSMHILQCHTWVRKRACCPFMRVALQAAATGDQQGQALDD